MRVTSTNWSTKLNGLTLRVQGVYVISVANNGISVNNSFARKLSQMLLNVFFQLSIVCFDFFLYI